MPPAVRLGDKAACPADAHGCPACPHPTIGPTVNGSPNVMINKMPAIRLGDPGVHAACCGPNQYKTAKGSSTVYVNGKPLVRMGDKTSHCGGSGSMIQGSPNVFADDGGLAAAKAGGAKAKDRDKRDAQDGKYDGKKKDKNGNWQSKNGKGKDGKGKDGKGGGEDGKNDEDLSKDDEEAKNDEIHSVKWMKEVAKLGEKIAFVVECGSAVVGSIQVVVNALGSGDQKKELTQTSVEAKLQAEGSVQIKQLDFDALKEEIGLQGKVVKLGIEATYKEKTKEGTNVCVIATGGTIVFALYDEQAGSDPEPDNKSASKPVIVTAAERGDTPAVTASIKIVTEDGEYTVEAEFDDDGLFIYAPKDSAEYPADFPKEVPGTGEAFDAEVVSVEVKHPEKYGKYKVKAFFGGVTSTTTAKVKAKPDKKPKGGGAGSSGGGSSGSAGGSSDADEGGEASSGSIDRGEEDLSNDGASSGSMPRDTDDDAAGAEDATKNPKGANPSDLKKKSFLEAVLEDDNGQPLAKVKVKVWLEGEQESAARDLVTDASGKLRLDDVPEKSKFSLRVGDLATDGDATDVNPY